MPIIAPVARMLCSQYAGQGSIERIHKITKQKHTTARSRQSEMCTAAYTKVAVHLRRKRLQLKREVMAKQTAHALEAQTSREGGHGVQGAAEFVGVSVLEVLMDKAGSRAARIRSEKQKSDEVDAVAALLSLSLEPPPNETEDDKKAREDEEREEIELDNAEEAVWSSGNIGQNLEECFNSLDLRSEKDDCLAFPFPNMTDTGV